MPMYLSGTMDGPLCEVCGHLLPPSGVCRVHGRRGDRDYMLAKSPSTAQMWFDKLGMDFVAEHNYGHGDPFYDECLDASGMCCCSVCQGLSGPAGAIYINTPDDV